MKLQETFNSSFQECGGASSFHNVTLLSISNVGISLLILS